jgi:lipid-A-disaccharide synthase-like uncharacterized protein
MWIWILGGVLTLAGFIFFARQDLPLTESAALALLGLIVLSLFAGRSVVLWAKHRTAQKATPPRRTRKRRRTGE